MKVVPEPAAQFMRRLLRLLRWRVWIQEKLQPTEWQITLLWAALAGFLGALASLIFTTLAEDIPRLFSKENTGIVDAMSRLPWWGCLLIPALGGACAGLILLLGRRFTRH